MSRRARCCSSRALLERRAHDASAGASWPAVGANCYARSLLEQPLARAHGRGVNAKRAAKLALCKQTRSAECTRRASVAVRKLSVGVALRARGCVAKCCARSATQCSAFSEHSCPTRT